VKAGDTFLVASPETTYDSHLWIVINDPNVNGDCVIVNFTSWRQDKDQACVLELGDHPYIRRKTCVNYKDAKHMDQTKLDTLVASKGLKRHDPVSQPLLQRIREGVYESRMELRIVEVLEAEGVISLD